jgi:hypothetical protein
VFNDEWMRETRCSTPQPEHRAVLGSKDGSAGDRRA